LKKGSVFCISLLTRKKEGGAGQRERAKSAASHLDNLRGGKDREGGGELQIRSVKGRGRPVPRQNKSLPNLSHQSAQCLIERNLLTIKGELGAG